MDMPNGVVFYLPSPFLDECGRVVVCVGMRHFELEIRSNEFQRWNA